MGQRRGDAIRRVCDAMSNWIVPLIVFVVVAAVELARVEYTVRRSK